MRCRLLVCACVLLAPAVAAAQDSPAIRELHPHRATRLYFGMGTVHLKQHVLAISNNWAIGMSHRGYFGATFVNTFGRRAFTGGIERTIVSSAPRPVVASIGYRLGLVTGYDGRLMRLARKTPVMPLAQAYTCIDIEHVGVEVSYTFVVVSVAVSYRF